MTQATAISDSPEMTAKRRRTVAWVVSLCSVALIFDGYDLVVYGAVLPKFIANPSLLGPVDKGLGGLLGSYALFGVLVGALIAGTVSDVLGRRKVILVAMAWFSVGMFITAQQTTSNGFGIWRFITGLGVGALVATVGALVAEFAPPGKKNLMNALVYMGVPLGSLLSALIAILLLDPAGERWKTMFMIGSLPFVTLLPLAIWKMPESVAWLASRGKLDEARRVSEKTGVPVPDVQAQAAAKAAAMNTADTRSGWAGLFTVYLIPTILLGLVSATGLLLVYSLNTWLPALMTPLLGAQAALSLLLVLNGGAVLGALFGSRFADRFGPQRVVIICFLIGAVAIFLLTTNKIIGLLLLIIAVVGVGTSGTQTLIFGLVANYYRANVRGAGVAWAAGFGRLGGVGGPILGGWLATRFADDLNMIFVILSAFGLVGAILTFVVPRPKASDADIQAINVEPTKTSA